VSSHGSSLTAVAVVMLLIASAATGVTAAIVAVRRVRAARDARPPITAVTPPAAPAEPIAAEAQVFRTGPDMLAIEPASPRQRTAHPRTRATYRFLRAYPGAPPRIPHPLSADEFRTGVCRSCHERGGYSPRFAAYVPLTPHAERGVCLQCHVGDDSAMGLAAADADPSSRCSLCHGSSGGRPRPEAAATWTTAVWPQLPQTTADQNPPPIPHNLQFRENCVACHSGPAAVAEIRTKHPERANCRQCHVALDPDAETFSRPRQNVAAGAGSPP
jgi:nitrate reductase (cytochrome), electron transfer subunit